MNLIVAIPIFLTGVFTGILLSAVGLLIILSKKSKTVESNNDQEKTFSSTSLYEQSTGGPSTENISIVKTIIKFLDEFNSPLKGFGNDLDRIRTKDPEGISLEDRMKKKITGTTIQKY